LDHRHHNRDQPDRAARHHAEKTKMREELKTEARSSVLTKFLAVSFQTIPFTLPVYILRAHLRFSALLRLTADHLIQNFQDHMNKKNHVIHPER
jgi:hypothetical protein